MTFPSLLSNLYFSIFALAVLCACSSYGVPEFTLDDKSIVEPKNRNIRYTGRLAWKENAALLSWPATQIEFITDATSLAVNFDDADGKNYYNVFIDNDYASPQVLSLKKGEHFYSIDLPQNSQKKHIKIIRRTEGQDGFTLFKSIATNANANFFELAQRPRRRIEIYGDSITTGMGNEADLEAEDDDLADKNSFMSYGAIAARELDAEFVSISQSGIGLLTSWFEYTMFDLYDQTDSTWDNETLYNFTLARPDVLVINLFQNDSFLLEKNFDPVPSNAAIVETYRDFITILRDHYPSSFIICALGSMEAAKSDSPWPDYIASAVELHIEATGDGNITSIVFPNEGYDKHPRVVHHKKNAAILVNVIKANLGW